MKAQDGVRPAGASLLTIIMAAIIVYSFSRPAEAAHQDSYSLLSPPLSADPHGAWVVTAPGTASSAPLPAQHPLLTTAEPIERQVASSWFIVWLAARYYPGFCEDLPTHLLEMCGEEKRKAELERRHPLEARH